MSKRSKDTRTWSGNDPYQPSLFVDPRIDTQPPFNPFPPVHRTEDGFRRVLASATPEYGLGLDFEFYNDRPTIIGIANATESASLKWTPALGRLVLDSGLQLIGHSIHGAEKRVMQKALGVEIPVDRFDDSMLVHYLANADFTKGGDKEVEAHEGGASGGFLNLWVASSLYTTLSNWKSCRHSCCFGPCSTHDVFAYNAVDAYASPLIFHAAWRDLDKKGVPRKFYRELMELGEICERMQQQGIRIDKARVDQLNQEMEERKNALYPEDSRDFNPRSGKQIIPYFQSLGVTLENTQKADLDKTLGRLCKKEEVDPEYLDGVYREEGLDAYLDALGKLPRHIAELHKLHIFKMSGKGLDAWTSDDHLTKEGSDYYIHPRFNITGTCTGRLSSSRPNVQNLPRPDEGTWGEKVRSVIIPPDGFIFGGADFSQLELRMALFMAGVDPYDIGKDAFVYLLERGGGEFERAASLMGLKSGRHCAKTVAYGSLYGEGLKLLSPRDISDPRIKKDIDYGCLRVYPNWQFRGHTVAFTGAHLAERFFGTKSRENRKKALEIQEDVYFARFPMIRQLHQKIAGQLENTGYLKSIVGRYLELYGDDDKDLKSGWSFYIQGAAADHVQAVMIRYYRELGIIARSQIHDELILAFPIDTPQNKIVDTLSLMEEETWRIPGYRAPVSMKIGNNFGEMKKVER